MRQHSVHTLVWETQALSSGGERGGEISCIVELFHFDASGWVFLFSLWQRYSLVEILLIASTSHYAAWTIALSPPPSARTRPRSTSVTRRQAASFGQNYLPAVVSDLLSKLPEGRSCRLFHDASLRVPARSPTGETERNTEKQRERETHTRAERGWAVMRLIFFNDPET